MIPPDEIRCVSANDWHVGSQGGDRVYRRPFYETITARGHHQAPRSHAGRRWRDPVAPLRKNGDEKGLVTYDPKTETYELEELGTHQTFQFDNIDLAAMEIYDLMDFDEDDGTSDSTSDQAPA